MQAEDRLRDTLKKTMRAITNVLPILYLPLARQKIMVE